MNDDLPLPDLHEKVMRTYYERNTGSAAHDDFACLITTYKYNSTSDRFRELADVCEKRLARLNTTLPLDLISAYHRLARLAKWRAAQLETHQ